MELNQAKKLHDIIRELHELQGLRSNYFLITVDSHLTRFRSYAKQKGSLSTLNVCFFNLLV